MADNLKEKAFNGILWSSLDGATKVISFVIGVLIARLLMPVIAMNWTYMVHI